MSKSEFSRNVLKLLTGTAFAQIITVVFSPVLTRLYSPKDFGNFVFFVAIVGFLTIIFSYRYEQAILIPKSEKIAFNLLFLCILLISGTSVLVFLIIFAFGKSILLFFNILFFDKWFFLVPFSALLVSMFNLLVNFNNRLKNYSKIANTSVIKSATMIILQIIFGLFKVGVFGLIIGHIMSQLIANIILLESVIKKKYMFRYLSFKMFFKLAKRYSSFPKYNLMNALVGNIRTYLPIYIFTPFYGSQIVGKYSLCMSVVMTPLSIISNSLSKVYIQQLVDIFYNDRQKAYSFTVSLLKKLFRKFFIPYSIFIVFAPYIFGLIFGLQWKESGIYLQLLFISIFLNFLVSCIAYIPNLINMQKKAMLVTLLHISLLGIGLYIISNSYSIYLALFYMNIINSIILLYNMRWMTKDLKEDDADFNNS